MQQLKLEKEEDYCSPQLFKLANDFLLHNQKADNWFLQLECFDPHEPFHAPERLRSQYKTSYKGPILDWPIYDKVTETPEEIAELRANYSALVSMTDEYFGELLDYFDEHDMWSDTALVLTTDHGFLLGEHDCCPKIAEHDTLAYLLICSKAWQQRFARYIVRDGNVAHIQQCRHYVSGLGQH